VERLFQIDSEAIIGVAIMHLNNGGDLKDLPNQVLTQCKGTISCALTIPGAGKVLLFSNNGSLFMGKIEGATYFASERYPLEALGSFDIEQIWHEGLIIDIPESQQINLSDDNHRKENLIPVFKISLQKRLCCVIQSTISGVARNVCYLRLCPSSHLTHKVCATIAETISCATTQSLRKNCSIWSSHTAAKVDRIALCRFRGDGTVAMGCILSLMN